MAFRRKSCSNREIYLRELMLIFLIFQKIIRLKTFNSHLMLVSINERTKAPSSLCTNSFSFSNSLNSLRHAVKFCLQNSDFFCSKESIFFGPTKNYLRPKNGCVFRMQKYFDSDMVHSKPSTFVSLNMRYDITYAQGRESA